MSGFAKKRSSSVSRAIRAKFVTPTPPPMRNNTPQPVRNPTPQPMKRRQLRALSKGNMRSASRSSKLPKHQPARPASQKPQKSKTNFSRTLLIPKISEISTDASCTMNKLNETAVLPKYDLDDENAISTPLDSSITFDLPKIDREIERYMNQTMNLRYVNHDRPKSVRRLRESSITGAKIISPRAKFLIRNLCKDPNQHQCNILFKEVQQLCFSSLVINMHKKSFSFNNQENIDQNSMQHEIYALSAIVLSTLPAIEPDKSQIDSSNISCFTDQDLTDISDLDPESPEVLEHVSKPVEIIPEYQTMVTEDYRSHEWRNQEIGKIILCTTSDLLSLQNKIDKVLWPDFTSNEFDVPNLFLHFIIKDKENIEPQSSPDLCNMTELSDGEWPLYDYITDLESDRLKSPPITERKIQQKENYYANSIMEQENQALKLRQETLLSEMRRFYREKTEFIRSRSRSQSPDNVSEVSGLTSVSNWSVRGQGQFQVELEQLRQKKEEIQFDLNLAQLCEFQTKDIQSQLDQFDDDVYSIQIQKNKRKASVMFEAIRTKITLISSSMTMYKSLNHNKKGGRRYQSLLKPRYMTPTPRVTRQSPTQSSAQSLHFNLGRVSPQPFILKADEPEGLKKGTPRFYEQTEEESANEDKKDEVTTRRSLSIDFSNQE